MSFPLRQWLERLGLAQYGDRFEADDIDLDVLPSLSEQDLEKLGVSMGHRKKLLKAVAELGDAAPARVAPGAMAVAHTPTRSADPVEARKVVTILFADLAGSTALHERLDPESVRSFMESYYRAMRTAIEAHGGTLVKFLGDGVMAAFGVPHVAEDDASRAVRAGVAMQQAFRALARAHAAIGLRVAINTGEVVVSADNTDVVGDPVNVAARLQQDARDGDVVLGESTRRLVAARMTLEPLGSVALKGRTEPVKLWRVVSLEAPTGAATAAFVGRDEELARITAVYDEAIAGPASRLAVVLGSPGLGKSRLIEESVRRQGASVCVLSAHCDAAGGATFAPVAQALRPVLGLEAGASLEAVSAAIEAAIPGGDAERARIVPSIAALLAGSPAPPEETFFAIRRLLTGLAQARPVVLVIDDLHWAEPLLLDLVEHLVQWGSGVPLLVLVGARPELRDLRSSLVAVGGLVSAVVTLSGLDAGAAMRLAANVIGAADLPAAVAAKVLATSEGNPLFVGELVRMLVDEGAIERQGERWVVGANLAALEMPPTIHALLAARIERLGPEERTVLERAAVVGRHFSRSAVAALLGRNGSELDARLEALRRTELIERDTGWFLGEPGLRFHHVLIRDAAYRRLLKGTRAELHAHLADWIEAQVKDAPEHDETIGWHLEQAHRHLRELGPINATGKTLGERAAQRLAAAGRRALGRDDLPVAADLLGRAIDRLESDDPSRADLALDWCEALLAGGDVATGAQAIEELGRFARAPDRTDARISRLRAWHACFSGQLTVLTAPQALHTTGDAVASAAAELAALDDASGEAKGHFVHALALARLGEVGRCEAALDKALAAARRAGDRRRANTVLAIAPLAALWGPSPVTRASGRCLDVVRVLRITQGAPAVESVALSCQAVLEALRGRTDAGRRMLASSRKMVEDLGITHRLLEADVFGGLIDLLEGDATAAEHSLRRAYDGLRDLGLGIDAARAAALLARALLAQDRGAEAETLSHESEVLAGDDLKAAIAWRGVRAEALAQRGEHAAAVELAQAAVAIAAATDALLDHADARLALAAALRAAGRGVDADAEERRAIELWEAKGATLLVERTRRTDPPAAATAPAAQPGAVPALRRRITPNRASAALVAFNAAMAAPDFAAFREQLSEAYEEIDHPTGVSYGRDANVAALQRLMRSRDASCQLEPLATLGDALVLSRRRVRASATGGGRFDVGEYEQDAYTVAEVNDRGRYCRHEVFAADQLGDATVHLYQRHAELLPDGCERERAKATTRSFGVVLTSPSDVGGYARVIAPDFESVDHRHLSTWSMRGGDAFLAHLRALQEVAADIVIGTHDVLALAPGAVLFRRLHSGTERLGGGVYERPFLVLFASDVEGRLARAEWFDADHDAEALVRFDELVTGTQRAARRRVTPNAATESIERFGAAIAARDLDALGRELREDVETVHHQTGTTYGRRAFLTTWRSMFMAKKMVRQQDTIASLGDSLALAHHTMSLEGFTEAHLSGLGSVGIDEVVLFEVDDQGQARRFQIFATEKLGAAIVHLYERYAELLPEGPERERAAATARSVAVWNGPLDLDRMAATWAPLMECVDHRSLHLWSARGAEEFLAQWRGQFELASGSAVRCDDVLAIAPAALLARQTFFGNDRATGGFFDHPVLILFAFGDDGLLTRVDVWEGDHEAEALARLDDLVAGTHPRHAVHRRVTPNAGGAAMARIDDALAAGDFDRFATEIGPDFEEINHPNGVTYGREAMLRSVEHFLRLPGATTRHELLATLGDRLWLLRRWMGASAAGRTSLDVGEFEKEEIGVHEVDEHGLALRNETFAGDRLGDALVRLYERYAELLPEGPQRRRAAGIARSLAAFNGRIDLDRVRAAYDPSLRNLDHRVFSTWSAEDAETLLQHFRLQLDLAPDYASRYDDVLAANANTAVASRTLFGTARDSGGLFEIKVCTVFRFGVDGRVTHIEQFEAEQDAEALACYDALVGGADAVADGFENAAARTDRALFERFNARDWPGIEALAAPDLVFDERRRMVRNTCGRDVWLDQFRVLYDVPSSRFTTELLGTRGERLCLSLHRFAGEVAGGGGPVEMDDHLVLYEVDGEGRLVTIMLFDLEDEDAAHAELDARFEAGEGAAHPAHGAFMRAYLRAVASGDWVPVLARMSGETFVEYDHRALAVLGTTRGAEAWVKNFSTLTDLAPDTIYRPEHFRSAARGFWCVGTWHGSREGGSYELPINAVLELDEHDRLVRSDIYDLDQADAAHARFVELQREAHESNRFANAATATVDPVIARMVAHDWPGFEQLFAEGFRMSDRRRMVQLELDRDQYVAFTREIAGGRAIRACSEIVATRGERLSLARSTFEFTDGDVGPSEVAFLILTQVDDRGRIDVYVRWDLEDLASAYAELDTRWAAHGAAEHPRVAQWLAGYLHAFAARDWTAMTALLTPDLIGQNHRLVGWGTRHGPEGVVSTLRAQIELAPDTQERVDHVRTCDGAVLFEYAWHGTREGGAFENLWLVLIELARDGRAHRADVWEPEQLDQARARFGEIAVREARGGPSGDHAPHATRLPIMSTAAIAAMERVYRSFDAQDWNAVRAACSSRFTWEDRRPIVGMSGDVELMIASARERLASGAHHERREVIGTAGDRVAVSRILWAGGPADGRFQVEFLAVNEIDADGLCTALIFFDPEDPRVAQREAWARWAVIDPTAAELTDSLGETIDAWNAEDPERLRATFAENLVVEDHRWTGTGRSEGREAYLRTVMALWELAPGTRFEAGWTWLARAPHGGVCVGQRSGTLPDGGEFVTDFLVVSVVERGLTTRAEIFGVEAADAALARFAELHPDPLRIPPNAVTRAYDRWLRALRIRDEDAVMALYAPSYAIEDRRSLVRTSIDLDEERGNVRWLVEGDWTAARTLLATAGDRLATHRIVWSRGEAGARSEIEALHVDEVDGDGRLLRRLMFDADDRAAAGRELNHRYLGITRPSALPRYEAFGDAGRDRARLRVALPDDFFFHDHRRTGLGLLEGADAYVASVAALYELAPDATVGQPLYHLADEPQGTLSIAHSFGTLASGGAFESVYVMIMLYGSGGMVGAELFELEDLEAAKTRFEELRATRTG